MEKGVEYLRNDDFIFSYWMGPGLIIWLVERKDELFIQSMINMMVHKVEHIPLNNRDQLQSVSALCKSLGFVERPCYCEKRNMLPEVKAELEEQFRIFEATVKQAEEKRVQQLKEQADKANAMFKEKKDAEAAGAEKPESLKTQLEAIPGGKTE